MSLELELLALPALALGCLMAKRKAALQTNNISRETMALFRQVQFARVLNKRARASAIYLAYLDKQASVQLETIQLSNELGHLPNPIASTRIHHLQSTLIKVLLSLP